MACKALKDKALGAMFSLLRNINKHRAVCPSFLFELFDKLVVPIVLYNSEVWGTSFIPLRGDFMGNNVINKHVVENLHLNFIKMVLGVSSRTTNWAVVSEVGRYPLAIRTLDSMFKFYQHLRESKSNIIINALKVSIKIHNEGGSSWYSHVSRAMDYFDMNYLKNCDIDVWDKLNKVKMVLKQSYDTKWSDVWAKMKLDIDKGKLGLFTNLKDQFSISEYITMVQNPYHIMAMTRMRVSAHRLPIETGRYLKISRELN